LPSITLSAILTLIYFFHGIELDYNSVFDNYTMSISLIGEIDPSVTPHESAKDNLKELDDIFDIPLDAFKVEINQTDLFVGTFPGTNLLL
jgi:hypothetical protein